MFEAHCAPLTHDETQRILPGWDLSGSEHTKDCRATFGTFVVLGATWYEVVRDAEILVSFTHH